LRGFKQFGWLCGYYPVSTTTDSEWGNVPGMLVLDGESILPIGATDIVLAAEGDRSGREKRASRSIQAIPRKIEDIPMFVFLHLAFAI
jgi:hypothetical protein